MNERGCGIFAGQMLRALLIAVLALPLCVTAQQSPAISWEFALSLSTSTDGQPFCLFLVRMKDGQVTESRPLTRDSFIRQIQGRTFSAANPDADDLFRVHNVAQCTLPPDSAAMGFLTDCSTLDDLWKLRYWEYPIKMEDGRQMAKGWSEKPLIPSPRQMTILNGYGMRFVNDLVTGEQMFRLLRDMGDRKWVVAYRNGA